jgi:FKBP-type peptidyl-prolyl cis-trans isomerase FkpA
MRGIVLGMLILAVCAGVQAADTPVATTPAGGRASGPEQEPAGQPLTPAETDKVMYALGQLVGKNLDGLSLTAHELAQVQKGLADAALGKTPAVDLKVYTPKVHELAKDRMSQAIAKTKAAGKAYVEKAAAESGATRLANGAIIKTVTAGTGASPLATDSVKVNYEGRLINGKVFDSSASSGGPASFRLNQVISCWTVAVQTMKVGGKAQLVCPSEIAYGDRQGGPIPPGSTLVFNIELLDIVK